MTRGLFIWSLSLTFSMQKTKLLLFRDKHTNITSKQILYVNAPFYMLGNDKIHYSMRHSVGLF